MINSPPMANGVYEETVTMTPVYIIGQNVEYPPTYEVSEVQHLEDDKVWTYLHNHIYILVHK